MYLVLGWSWLWYSSSPAAPSVLLSVSNGSCRTASSRSSKPSESSKSRSPYGLGSASSFMLSWSSFRTFFATLIGLTFPPLGVDAFGAFAVDFLSVDNLDVNVNLDTGSFADAFGVTLVAGFFLVADDAAFVTFLVALDDFSALPSLAAVFMDAVDRDYFDAVNNFEGRGWSSLDSLVFFFLATEFLEVKDALDALEAEDRTDWRESLLFSAAEAGLGKPNVAGGFLIGFLVGGLPASLLLFVGFFVVAATAGDAVLLLAAEFDVSWPLDEALPVRASEPA